MKVPSPVVYAHKLSKLLGETQSKVAEFKNMEYEIPEGLRDKLFYI